MLLATYSCLLDQGWKNVFPQARTLRRAIEHALVWPSALGRRTISQIICAKGGSAEDWSADYKLYSRSGWDEQTLFGRTSEEYLTRYAKGPVVLAIDDTRLPKSGKKIPGASWQRDPLSPPFQVNLMWGLRFLQGSLLFPHHREGDFSARAYPVGFKHVPVVKKPGIRASDEHHKKYRQLRKATNLTTQSLDWIRAYRNQLDDLKATDRWLRVVGDGSFCNRTFYKHPLDRVELLTRCRKDARLCFPAPEGCGRQYAIEVFTPKDVLQSPHARELSCKIWLGHKRRRVRYKLVDSVLWRRGAGARKLRLIVIPPIPYQISRNAPRNYREPGYLLSTDLRSPVRELIQSYVDRWQIEINHRDEKTILAVGQSQVWSPSSVSRQPALTVASYSLLLLAGLLCFGPGRSPCYPALPKWRTRSPRASLLDLLTLLRKEIIETSVKNPNYAEMAKNLVLCAKT
jgi:DDE superfamily endonuclease